MEYLQRQSKANVCIVIKKNVNVIGLFFLLLTVFSMFRFLDSGI